MEQIEIIGKRKPREKHYLKENGIIEAQLFDQDIHFLKNGIYEEIDNTLIKKNEIYENRNNSYKVQFNVSNENNKIYKIEKGEYYLEFFLNKHNKYNEEIVNKSKTLSEIFYHNILKNVDLKYEIVSSEIKENIILNDKDNDIDELCFDIKTNLNLKIDFDGSIIATHEKNVIFKFDTPYMIDSENNINKKISYNLIKDEDIYQLFMFIDKRWLETTAKYPVIIDPTITNYSNESSVIDTYIFPNDTNVSRGNLNYLKVGVEKSNNSEIVNRALLKFDLPVIGTGSQVVGAKLALYNYRFITTESIEEIINVHRITKDWNENEANWSNMNTAYDSRVEGVMNFLYTYYSNEPDDSPITADTIDITQLVQKWYTSTPNYGILLKLAEEKYHKDIIPTFYSKDYKPTSGDSPKPVLVISYRNQNGLENYMNYESHSFSKAKIYHNSYNGNLTTVYDIGTTSPGKLPVSLKLIYNTNDVVLNKNRGIGIGYKFNLYQTVKEVTIDNKVYLEYEDDDGTLHYFLSEKKTLDSNGNEVIQNEDNTYYDEDGLELKIKNYDDKFILIDKSNNEMKFTKYNNVGYLTEIKDVSGNTNSIFYDAEYKKIQGVMDANGSIINIIYNSSNINVVSPTDTVILSLLDEKILSGINYSDDSILITANQNYIMTSLTNISGRKIEYEYYNEIPYKLKKVSEYGTDNSLGNSYTTIYGFNCTTFIDSKGKRKVITFNSYGNPESSSIMKEENDIINAYGSKSTYGRKIEDDNLDLDKNKLLSSQIPIKYVKNLLTNTSFENGQSLFKSGQNGVSSISDEYSHSGLKSLKFEALYALIEAGVNQEVDVEKGKYYTFSAYIKRGYVTSNAFLRMHYEDSEGRYREAISNSIVPDEDFERLDVTIFYPSDAKGKLNLEVCLDGRGIIYIDDVQLEEGEVTNNYNMIENSDFSSGMDDWTLYSSKYNASDIFKVVDVKNQKALKINMLTDNSSAIEKVFNVKGKKGDNFTLSFWYKNTGLLGNGIFEDGPKNVVSMIFYPTDTEYGSDLIENYILNSNENDWQYFICNFTSDYDFSKFKLSIDQELNGNEFYITNINLFRDVRSVKYSYDENGNIVSTKNLNDKMNTYKYDKNNELIKMTDVKGKIFCYEYDNLVTDRVLRGISENGISNELEYDLHGNPVLTRIIDRGIMLKPNDGEYIIRLKGTSKIIRLINGSITISGDYHSHDKWKLEKVTIDSKDYYKIYHNLINEKYLTVSNNNIVLTGYQNDNSLFELIAQDNGSFSLKSKATSKYIKIENNSFVLAELVEDTYNFQFYFESNENPIFIEINAEYTEDGRYLTKIIDTNLNEIKYEINLENNTVKSITDPKNHVINYNYNSKNQLESIVQKNKKVSYEYNANNTLSKIIQGNRIYNFEYDEFLNIRKVKVGDKVILVENIYGPNNGNLLSKKYGNNQKIDYEYDDFDRIKTLIRNDDTYNYKYNNNGDLAKITSNNINIKYIYDLSKRLYEYSFNGFKIKYMYDDNNNVVKKEYMLGKNKFVVNNVLNDDELLTKQVIDSDEFNYIYDGIGRLKCSNINNQNIINYKYKNNGKRTSNLLESMMINNDIYNYEYDSLGNITKKIHNNVLEKEYYYDEYNQLSKEDDYLLNKTIKYRYDELGNMLTKQTYEIKKDNLLSEIMYKYENNNWNDLLTKYNNETIVYDQCGNPIKIGEYITLNWINGRYLNSYADSENVINYNYNIDGIRISKSVNNVKTNYYLEGNEIIFEQTNNDIIYYIHNNVHGLVGFKYNNNVYYYVKNNQDDVIGILDNNYNLVAKYEYDSWGNILSITNQNNIDVSHDNTHIANINPYRFRSYYYDKETRLYYLNSRYYNPEWCRFISPDNIVDSNIKNQNLYSYCANDPINKVDTLGNKFSFKKLLKNIGDLWKKSIKNVFSAVGRTEVNKVSKKDVKIYGNPIIASLETGKTTTKNLFKAGSNSSNKAILNIDSSDPFNSSIDLNAGNIGGVTLGLSELSLNLSLNFDKWSGTIKLGLEDNGSSIFGEASFDNAIGDKLSKGKYGKMTIGPFPLLAVAVIAVTGSVLPIVSLASILNQISRSTASTG